MKKQQFHRRKLALKPGYMLFRKAGIERVPARITNVELTTPWIYNCRACGQKLGDTVYRVTIILDSHPDEPQHPTVCEACGQKAQRILAKGSEL